MSKRTKNRSGKRGRGIRNTQYCKERGTAMAKKMRSRAGPPQVEVVPDPKPIKFF